MRLLATVLGGVLATAGLTTAGSAVACDRPEAACVDSVANTAPLAAAVDAGQPAETRTGTDAEVQDYARREAESPDVQKFAGGVIIIGVSVLAVVVIVLLVLLLSN